MERTPGMFPDWKSALAYAGATLLPGVAIATLAVVTIKSCDSTVQAIAPAAQIPSHDGEELISPPDAGTKRKQISDD
jgi:hypothetical protein